MENLFCITIFVIVFIVVPCLMEGYHRRREATQTVKEPPPDNLNYTAAIAYIDQIQAVRKRLNAIEKLLTYLEMTPPLYRLSGQPQKPNGNNSGTPFLPCYKSCRKNRSTWSTKPRTERRRNVDRTGGFLNRKVVRIYQKEGDILIEIKHCKICGKVIGDAYNTDWYAFISQKYCKECRIEHDRNRKAEWAREHRRKVALAKAEAKATEQIVEKEQLQLQRAKSRELTLQRQKNKAMEQEIDALHEYIIKLREKTYQD